MRTEKDFKLKGEIVSFAATDGAMLYAIICKPKRASKTAIINIHGLGGNFYRGFAAMEMSKALPASGFTFMSIETRGSHNRFKINVKKGAKWSQLVGGSEVEVFEDCVHDIAGAVKYLKANGIKRIYLSGHSTGCQKEIYYLDKKAEKAVKGMILLAPADDYNIWKNDVDGIWGKDKGRGFAQAVSFARAKAKKNPNAHMSERYPVIGYSAKRFLSFSDPKRVEARLLNYDSDMREFSRIKIPILAIFGSKEQFAVKPIREYLRILGRHTSSHNFMGGIMPGANHNFRTKEKELARFVCDWIVEMEREIE